MRKFFGYLYGGLTTTLNIALYTVTFGQFLWLEGRVSGGVFRNWAGRFKYRPKSVHYPQTERELMDLIRRTGRLRVIGSGHSFNSGVVSEDALVSLDRLDRVVEADLEKKTLTVQGGMRVRDISRALLERGLAFAALPSHDAQSIGGILSSDVHGTGRDWGFVSESVVAMRVVDGRGEVHTCEPGDDLFKAAIGGVGGVGVISQVTIQAVDRFRIKQSFQISTLTEVEARFEELHSENEHFGLFLFPFTEKCQLNRWNATDEPKSFMGSFREFIAISADALLASWVGNALAYTKLLPATSNLAHSIKRGSNLVLESFDAHNRSIYHIHQELEVAIDCDKVFPVCRKLLAAYEELYSEGLPYPIFEIRFTPAGHDRTLIGAGRGRRSAWIDIICCDSPGYERFYARAEEIFKATDGRPHLGKYVDKYASEDLATMHGKYFYRYLELMSEHDPEGKFRNAFTKQMLIEGLDEA